jgi:hypothetical protein
MAVRDFAMKDRVSRVKGLCADAIKRVDQAIDNHSQGKAEDLSIPMLNRIQQELKQMEISLSPPKFKPTYGRFILDWPDEHGLIKMLSEVACEYGRLK